MRSTLPRSTLALLAALAVLPRPAAADVPVRCTGNHGNVLVCGGEQIPGITVSTADDGAYSSVSWREHFGEGRWRDIALNQSGLVHFIYEGGEANASKWLSLSQWIFPRTQRLTIARYAGGLRFDVTDASGQVWTLVGTRLSWHEPSFAVESIGGHTQPTVPPAKTHAGVMGVDLGAARPLWLEHRVTSFSPHADFRAAPYLKTRSTFHDRRGGKCAVPNREIFGPRAGRSGELGLPFDTDAQLAAFLAERCPALDVEPLRSAVPPPEPRRDRFNRCLPGTAKIATPSGEVRVDELVQGAFVWTVDERGRRVETTVARVGSVEVGEGHELLRISLADGRTATGSRYHPTAGGAFLGELAPGDLVDGSAVVRVESVPYKGARTYDLLPAGPTGHYYADGVLLGSTLRAPPPPGLVTPGRRKDPTGKLFFTRAEGCKNDGSIEFCVAKADAALQAEVRRIAPAVRTGGSRGRVGCEPGREIIFFFPTPGHDPSVCTARHGALTDRAWGQLRALAALDGIKRFAATWYE
jgi:hypothetical protein